jgi:hypothetical protein
MMRRGGPPGMPRLTSRPFRRTRLIRQAARSDMPVSSRTRYALVGVAVGLGCAGFIVHRLVQASGPQPTTLQFANGSARPIVVSSLRLGTEVVLSAETPFAAASGGAPSAHFESRAVPLAPGRPVGASVQIAGAAGPVSCEPEPRPGGICVVKLTVTDSATAQCAFDCKSAEAAQPGRNPGTP